MTTEHEAKIPDTDLEATTELVTARNGRLPGIAATAAGRSPA
ncbi:MAG: hypothetical protein ACRD0P_32320 [Stackebrandtia sp.]